jgi:hypothetical protein
LEHKPPGSDTYPNPNPNPDADPDRNVDPDDNAYINANGHPKPNRVPVSTYPNTAPRFGSDCNTHSIGGCQNK